MPDFLRIQGTDFPDQLDYSNPADKQTKLLVQAGAGADLISLANGSWAIAGSGDDTITGVGAGTFGLRFDDSPQAVLVRVDWGRVENDGFGNRDYLQGINAFVGSAFNDTIIGSNANEYFGSADELPRGNDSYVGGGGFDAVFYGAKFEDFRLEYSNGSDRVFVTYLGKGTRDVLEGIGLIQFLDKSLELRPKGNGNFELNFSDAADVIDASAALPPALVNRWGDLRAGAGNDLILWRSGQLRGGPGDDTIQFAGSDQQARANYDDNLAAVLIDLQNQYAIDGWGGRDSFVNVRAVRGSSYADTILGSSGNDWIEDPYGGDTIDGAGGDDTIWFWTDRKNYLTTYDEANGLYTVRWDQDRGYFSFKNIETIRLAAPGQNDRNLTPSEFLAQSNPSNVKDLRIDLLGQAQSETLIQAGPGNDKIVLTAGKWVVAGSGYDQIQGYGYGTFGIRFDNSPKSVTVRADWGRVEDDGFGYRDALQGINAYFGSPFNDYINGSWWDESFGSRTELSQGNDTFVGGGGYDIALFAANYADFSIQIDAKNDQSLVTFNKTGSTTSLTGIAKLVFADREVQLKQAGNNAPEMFFGEGAQKIIEDELIPASEIGRWRHVYGGPGNDLIVWRSGQLKGGPGDDTIQFAGSDQQARANYDDNLAAVFIDLQNQYAIDGWGGRDSFVNVRAVRGSSYADTILGSSGNDWIEDPYGGDTIDGAGGNDTIWFWTDRKNYVVSYDEPSGLYTVRWDQDRNYFAFKNIETIRLAAPGQNDRNLTPSEFLAQSNPSNVKDLRIDLIGQAQSETLIQAGPGNDKIVLTAGKWVVAGSGYDQIQGYGYGTFGIRFDNSPKGVTVRADWGRVEDDGFGYRDALQGINAFFGSPYNDYFHGSSRDDSFGSSTEVSQGNDTYRGGGGFDTLYYPLARSDYLVSYDVEKQAGTVSNLRNGSIDSIEQISEIRFKDEVLTFQSVGNTPSVFFGSASSDQIRFDQLLPQDRLTNWVDYRAGDGDDMITWRSGNVSGGIGNDTIASVDGGNVWLALEGAPKGFYIDLKAGYVLDGWGGRDSLIGISAVNLSGNNGRSDTVIGSDRDDRFYRGSGGDLIDGAGGNDYFDATNLSRYSISVNEQGELVIRDGPGSLGATTLRNIETVKLNSDGQQREWALADLLKTAVADKSFDLSKQALPSGKKVVEGGLGADSIILTPGTWAMAGSGFDSISVIGSGIFGIRFDNSPAAVEVRSGWGSVQNDGFGFQDRIEGVNAYIGSPFNDRIYGRWADEMFGSDEQAPQGNDTYIGGGGFDVVRYFGNAADFLVSRLPDLADGTSQRVSVKYLKTGSEDYLEGIAEIRFKDQTVPLFSSYSAWKSVWGGSQSDSVNQRQWFAAETNLPWAEYRAGDGADKVVWVQGAVYGGMGNDTIEVEGDGSQTTVYYGERQGYGGTRGVYVNLLEGYAIDEWGDRDSLVNVKRVGLTGADDTMLGSTADDYFWDTGGHDVIDGGAGTDTYSLYLPNKGNYAIKASEDLREIRISWDGSNNQSGSVRLKDVELVRLDKGSNQSDVLKISDLIQWSTQAPKALIAGESIRWGSAKSPLGSSAEVSFSFMEQPPSYGMGGEAGATGLYIPPTGFVPFNAAQKDMIKLALQAASTAAGLTFREVPDSDSAQIRFGANLQANTKGYAYLPDERLGPIAGDIWLDAETLQLLSPGKEGFWVVLHELGHALGLVHPSVAGSVTGRAVISPEFDDTRYTVMSEKFFSANQFPANFSMFDVLALQYLYGPSKAGQGDTQYLIGAGRSNAMTTILDSSGYDVIDASKASTGVYVDLHGGSLLSAGRNADDFYALFNWAIGYETEIEKLIGSDFDDIFIGTDRAEWFVGRDGNDQIDGAGGLDTAQYLGPKSDYDIYVSAFSGRRIVASVDGESGADSLRDVERLVFTDRSIAYDLDGAAGEAARMVATVFGGSALQKPAIVSIALKAYDQGLSDAVVAERLLASADYLSMWGDRSDATVLRMLFTNVLGRVPTELEYQQLLPIFGHAPQSAVVALVADFPAIDELINLVGLSASGIGFGP